jgi:cation transporter-like permease
MVWRPNKALGLSVGLVFILTTVGVDVYLVRTMLGQPFGLNLLLTALLMALSVPLFLLFCYYYLSLMALRYHLDRNGLVITSIGYRYSIPMHSIRELRRGTEVVVERGFRGIGWPGYLRGRVQLAGLGPVRIYSTQPLKDQVIVVTDLGSFGISPRRPADFLADYERRSALGPMRELAPEVLRLDLAGLPVWQDWAYWAVMVPAVLADIVLFGWLAARFGGLPESIPFHVVGTGEVARIAAKSSLLMIPAVGTLSTIANGLLGFILHRRQRLATYLLLVAIVLVHGVVILATYRVLR